MPHSLRASKACTYPETNTRLRTLQVTSFKLMLQFYSWACLAGRKFSAPGCLFSSDTAKHQNQLSLANSRETRPSFPIYSFLMLLSLSCFLAFWIASSTGKKRDKESKGERERDGVWMGDHSLVTLPPSGSFVHLTLSPISADRTLLPAPSSLGHSKRFHGYPWQ